MAQQVTVKRSEHNRSLFWPIVLISIGVVWLLGNLGVISSANISVLFRLWPLILIIVGVELLIGRNSPSMSGIIGVGAVLLIIALMLVGPSLGWASDAEVKTATFSEPVGDASSARIELNLGIADTTVTPLNDSASLLTADVTYIGEIEFVTDGETNRFVSLSQSNEAKDGIFNFFGGGWLNLGDDLRWNIGLSPDVPVKLNINGGIGAANLDLTELQIADLSIHSGVGEINVNFPAAVEEFSAVIEGGVGTNHLTIPAGPDVNLNVNGGVGESTIRIPEGAGVRVEAESGVGGVNVPGSFVRLSGDEDDFLGENGIWQTGSFAEADQQIVIIYQGGVGSLTIES
jgi:hypothetical protein